MKGLLIYDAEGAERNKWFISRLIESARDFGHELELVISDGDEIDATADFAIVRTINPSLNAHFESLGIPTFNNAKTARIANDKWQTYLFAKELGVAVMDTLKTVDAKTAIEAFGLPFVMKTVDGHGGSEVFLVDNEQKCKEFFSKSDIDRYICQRKCSEPGVDMRVYMLGGRVLAAAKRTSLSDFRSNFSLGGKAEIVDVPNEIQGILVTVTEALGCDFVGIDFIRHNGEWVLNEIEDVVGTRMLYSLTDLDAARLYTEYIISKLR